MTTKEPGSFDDKTTKLKAADELALTWEFLIGKQMASPRTLHILLHRFNKDVVNDAIIATASKFERETNRGVNMTANDLERYLVATARHMSERQQAPAAEVGSGQ